MLLAIQIDATCAFKVSWIENIEIESRTFRYNIQNIRAVMFMVNICSSISLHTIDPMYTHLQNVIDSLTDMERTNNFRAVALLYRINVFPDHNQEPGQ